MEAAANGRAAVGRGHRAVARHSVRPRYHPLGQTALDCTLISREL
jgi:hypothetical protein